MGSITIKGFRGEIPRTSPRLLQQNQATRARNITLTSGRLDPLRGTTVVTSPSTPGVKTIYRYRFIDDTGTVLDNWLTWTKDVDVVPSILSNDALGRFYFTSESFEPRMAAYADAIAGGSYPTGWYVLGVTPPTVKPGLAVAGGSGATESRAYLYTYVNRYGEESPPCPATDVVTGFTNGTWNLTGLQTAPTNSGTISAVANNTPGIGYITLTLNTVFGIEADETLTISGALGMTDLNGDNRIVSVDKTLGKVVIGKLTSQVYTSGATWARTAPHNTTGMTKRIYRSAGLASPAYLFVDEIAAATTTYADTKAATALGETIETLVSLPPPKNLKCLIALPNGCLAGIADNDLCFSEPYKPYSWPSDNRYSFSGKGVALAPAGNSVIVLTDTFPVMFIGSDPEAMSPSVMETYAPCASKRGTVNVGGGCIYPSFDGLWLAVPGSVQNITKTLFRTSEWSLLNPASFTSDVYDGQYIAAYVGTDGVAALFVLDIEERDSVVFIAETVDHLMRSEYDGKLYALIGNKIVSWATSTYARYAADWISATLQVPAPMNWGCAQVFADYGATVLPDADKIAANNALIAAGANAVAGDLCGNEVLDVEICSSNLVLTDPSAYTRNVQFTLYSNGVPIFSRPVTSAEPFRLPGGTRSEVFNIGLSATVPVYSVVVAHTMSDLAQAAA